MTTRYVRSGAGGSANGTSWANAYLSLANALNASAAGDVIYVSEDHAESQASTMSLTSPGSAVNPVKVICVDHTGTVPPVSADLRTTATVSTTSSNGIVFGGSDSYIIYDGLTFTSGSSGGSVNMNLAGSAGAQIKFRNGALRLGGSSAGNTINTGNAGGRIELENTTMQFAATTQGVAAGGRVIWRNTPNALSGATFPATLFTPGTSGCDLEVDGVDLSAITGTIVGTSSGQGPINAKLVDCKINASATIAAARTKRGDGVVEYTRIDSGGTNYKQGKVCFEGSQSVETTIVRTGGASDGTTPISWKIVTTANCTEHFPYESIPIAIWNDTTGSPVTATIQGIWGGGSVPNVDDIWGEVEYLGSSASPLGSFANDGKADILAASVGQTAGSGTWGGSTTKFEIAVTFTPQQKGYILFRVKAAKASSTFYIDPKITLS